jgi:hypothetical protein
MKFLRSVIILFALYLATASALYSKSDDVVQLTAATFEKKVLKSDGVW